jgi:hypothetical protein
MLEYIHADKVQYVLVSCSIRIAKFTNAILRLDLIGMQPFIIGNGGGPSGERVKRLSLASAKNSHWTDCRKTVVMTITGIMTA